MAPLTEARLAQHNLLMSEQKNNTEQSHAAKVVECEKIHQTLCQLGDAMGAKIDLDRDRLSETASKQQTGVEGFEIFCSLECLMSPDQLSNEGPLERFFTPDGCSDPCYFARYALGTQFANKGSVEARRLQAELCVETIVRNGNANKGSTQA